MRKTLLVTVIILGLALTGCGKIRNPTGQSEVNYQQQSAYPAEGSSAPNQRAGRMNANSVSGGTADVNPAAGETANTSKPANTPNTAQAENDLSDSDKAALLNQIDQELDALLSDMNNFDDVQDADLDFDLQ